MSINPRISLADLTATVHVDPSSDSLYGGGTSVPHCRAKALPPTISKYTFNARNQLVKYTKQDESNQTGYKGDRLLLNLSILSPLSLYPKKKGNKDV